MRLFHGTIVALAAAQEGDRDAFEAVDGGCHVKAFYLPLLSREREPDTVFSVTWVGKVAPWTGLSGVNVTSPGQEASADQGTPCAKSHRQGRDPVPDDTGNRWHLVNAGSTRRAANQLAE